MKFIANQSRQHTLKINVLCILFVPCIDETNKLYFGVKVKATRTNQIYSPVVYKLDCLVNTASPLCPLSILILLWVVESKIMKASKWWKPAQHPLFQIGTGMAAACALQGLCLLKTRKDKNTMQNTHAFYSLAKWQNEKATYLVANNKSSTSNMLDRCEKQTFTQTEQGGQMFM